MEKLDKAKREGGILFHSPGEASFSESLKPTGKAHTSFEGETHTPNPTVRFHTMPEQKAIEPHFNKIHNSPNFEHYFKPGNYSKGDNAKLVDTPHGAFLAKKSLPLHPADREDFGLDDRQFSQGEREMAYHHAAHNFFDMGKHVPLAALAHFPDKKEHWTMHQLVDGSKFRHGAGADERALSLPEEKMKIHKLHQKGIFQKALAMDGIMGNHDRHDGNVFYGDGDMQLIDHGMSLTTKQKVNLPSFYYTNQEFGLGHHRIHPEFRDWLLGLQPDHLNRTLAESGVPEAERQAATDRLRKAHRALISATTKGNNYRKFFEEFTRSHG